MTDLAAVAPNQISVKLRFGTDNSKLSRTPANLEAAIVALAQEYYDLYGPEALYNVTGALSELAARERAWAQESKYFIAAAIENLVNMRTTDKIENIGDLIRAELDDMEL
jgi:hypothetical protein